jgi:hypothetical protein
VSAAAVSKLEALLGRVKRNRQKPRLASAAPAAVELTREVVAPLESAPVEVVEAPRSPTEVALAPSAPAPVVTPPEPKPAEPARVAPPAASRQVAEVVSEVRDLGEAVPESAPEKKKAPAPSPLELAVESSVEMPLDAEEPAAEPAAAEARVETAADEAALDDPEIEIEEPELELEPPAGAQPVPAEATPSLEPERMSAADLMPSAPVATLASTLEAPKPTTFGELLERTLNLKTR